MYGDQIAILHIVGQRVVYEFELAFCGRHEDTAARFGGDAAQDLLSSERDTGHAADGHHVNRRLGFLQSGERLLDRCHAVFVVAIGDENHRPSTRRFGEAARDLTQRIQDGRSPGRPNRPDRLRHRFLVVGGSSRGQKALGEWRDDHPIQRRHVLRQRRRRPLYEIEPAGHAGAAIDEQRQGGAHGFVPGEVEDLRHAILQHAERRLGQSLDETSVLVLDRRFDHHAGDVRLLDDLEGFQHHGVADLAAQRVGNGHGDLAPLEWILIGPLDGVGRPILIGAEQLAIDEELHRAKRRAGLRLNLRHDADAAGHTAPAERGGYSDHRTSPIRNDRGGPVRTVPSSGRLQQEREKRNPYKHVDHA